MISEIKKRDGRVEPYLQSKVASAIFKAAQSQGGSDFVEASDLAENVSWYLDKKYGDTVPNVEEVQDAVERVLIENGHVKTAKAYILFRADRTRKRDMSTNLMKTFNDLTFGYSKDVDMKRENANINTDTPMGTMLKYGTESAKQFNHLYLLDKDVSEAHLSGDIHIHDLDFYALTMTCMQIDLNKLFNGGFCTGHGFVRTPNSIRSYSSLACIAIQSSQNDMHGGQSIPAFDHYLAQGVAKTFISEIAEVTATIKDIDDEDVELIKSNLKEYMSKHNERIINKEGKEFIKSLLREIVKDITVDELKKIWKRALKRTDRETYQSMEALLHNLNTMHSRAGSQVPFSSINYGTDTSEEARILMRNLLLATEKGMGAGETYIFPIQVFKVKEGVNYNSCDPNYDLFKLSMRVSAKRLFPNYVFIDAPHNIQYYQEGNIDSEIATIKLFVA